MWLLASGSIGLPEPVPFAACRGHAHNNFGLCTASQAFTYASNRAIAAGSSSGFGAVHSAPKIHNALFVPATLARSGIGSKPMNRTPFFCNGIASMIFLPACVLQARMQDSVPGTARCGRLNQ